MIKFEKVSFSQFMADCEKTGWYDPKKMKASKLREIYDNIQLPKRSTKGSAGYDFVTPFGFELYDSGSTSVDVIPTGIRAIMPEDVVLMLYPRSGLGFKTGMSLANTVGVIDSSYAGSDNEGHIMAEFVRGFKDLEVKAGDRVMQGIFTPYLITDDDNTTAVRNGGFGSTGK